MLQIVDGLGVFVVDFATMPELPIRGDLPGSSDYAWALTDAIETGIVTEPGKYGIHVSQDRQRYDIYKIIE